MIVEPPDGIMNAQSRTIKKMNSQGARELGRRVGARGCFRGRPWHNVGGGREHENSGLVAEFYLLGSHSRPLVPRIETVSCAVVVDSTTNPLLGEDRKVHLYLR